MGSDVGRAVVDMEVLPLNVSKLTQPVKQRREVRLVLCPRNGLQDADGVDLRLRTRRDRPRSRAPRRASSSPTSTEPWLSPSAGPWKQNHSPADPK
jgi:hypothetical protein